MNHGARQVAFAVTVDGPPPRENVLAPIIAAAKGAGFSFSCEKPYVHYFEKIDGRPVRHEIWTMDGAQTVTLDGAPYTFQEFRARYEDDAWIGANRASAIAMLRVATQGLQILYNGIMADPPHLMVRRGKCAAMIRPNESPERKAELLARLNGQA